MNSVLYVGAFREKSGWGQAARDYILAMDSVGIPVVPRCLKLGTEPAELPPRLLELEQQSSKDCDVCIQHVLPHYFTWNSRFKKNIGLFATETLDWRYSNWPDYINMMDEAWVINVGMEYVCKKVGVKIPINIVPHTTDIKKYEKKYEPFDIPLVKGNYVFYFIGELTRRKNLSALIEAFHCEFLPSEPVSLIIKTSKHGVSPEDCAREVINTASALKQQLRLYPKKEDYHSEIIISNHLKEEELYQVHATGDCFVMPSFGEAWCIPAMDAIGFGKPVIATNVGGLTAMINPPINGLTIPWQAEPIMGIQDTFNNYMTGFDSWASIDKCSLKNCMRQIYERRDRFNPNEIKNTIKRFSYENIGNLIKRLLND